MRSPGAFVHLSFRGKAKTVWEVPLYMCSFYWIMNKESVPSSGLAE